MATKHQLLLIEKENHQIIQDLTDIIKQLNEKVDKRDKYIARLLKDKELYKKESAIYSILSQKINR